VAHRALLVVAEDNPGRCQQQTELLVSVMNGNGDKRRGNQRW